MWRLLLILPVLMLVVPISEPLSSGKGLAGKATPEQMTELGATWWHHWRPCRAGEAETGCVDHVKARWTLDEGSAFYGDLDNMRERLALCEAGWFMFGDEYVLQNAMGWPWPMEKQVDELRWFLDLRDSINPQCKIAFGGVLAWHWVTHNQGAGPQ